MYSDSSIPPHCAPTTPFLSWYSATFHTCVPTPLAFISTLLGCLSIMSWLFAQLPQIVKNQRLKSTSGLSIFFLVEWCLGDMSNLFGALLTQQATWQVIIGAYYCSVDLILVGQWIWFEGLNRGRGLDGIRRRMRRDNRGSDGTYASAAPGNFGIPPEMQAASKEDQRLFESSGYGTIHHDASDVSAATPAQLIHTMPRRAAHPLPLPSPSPRGMLLVTMLIALHSLSVQASPVASSSEAQAQAQGLSLGTVLSWASTVLYLLSRLPQLIKNFRRRSTAGLSPLLFLAAFLGNLFYSSSLLCNPCLWYNFGPYGGGGWAGPDGSERVEWLKRALPFWLGAAGVLGMDASVGVQFWLWGGSERSEIKQIQVAEQTEGAPYVVAPASPPTGWMRGWIPSRPFSPMDSLRRFSPRLFPRDRDLRREEQQRLLGTESP